MSASELQAHISHLLTTHIVSQVLARGLPGEAVDHFDTVSSFLSSDANRLFDGGTSLRIAAEHAALEWPETTELSDRAKLQSLLATDPIVSEAVNDVVDALSPTLAGAYESFRFESGADAREIFQKITKRMTDFEKSNGVQECQIVAFNWGALSDARDCMSIESLCSGLTPAFVSGLTGATAPAQSAAAVFNQAQRKITTTSIDRDALAAAVDAKVPGVDADLVDMLVGRPSIVLRRAEENLRSDKPAQFVAGVAECSRLYRQTSLLKAAQVCVEDFEPAQENLTAVHFDLSVLLGAAMILRNGPVQNTLVFSGDKASVLVDENQYTALRTELSDADLVTVCQYFVDERNGIPSYGLSESTIRQSLEKAKAHSARVLATESLQTSNSRRDALVNIASDELRHWAVNMAQVGTPNELPEKVKSTLQETVLRLTAAQRTPETMVNKSMQAILSFCLMGKSTATKELAHQTVGAAESFGGINAQATTQALMQVTLGYMKPLFAQH